MVVLRRCLPGIGLVIVGFVLGIVAFSSWEHWHGTGGARAGTAEPAAEEPPPRRWEATLYLPLNDNHGKPFPDKDWQEAVSLIVKRFGGATLGAKTEGYWLDSRQRLQREPVQLVVVSFERTRLG